MRNRGNGKRGGNFARCGHGLSVVLHVMGVGALHAPQGHSPAGSSAATQRCCGLGAKEKRK